MPPVSATEALDRIRKATRDANPALVSTVLGATVTGLNIDPWLAAIIIGALMVDEPSDDPDEDRRRSLAEWKPRIKAKLEEWRETAAEQRAIDEIAPPPVSTAITTAPVVEGEYIPPPVQPRQPVTPRTLPTLPPSVETPPGAPPPPALPSGQGVSGTLIPAPPEGMPERLREAWIQARTRAGEYARGLGSVIEEWPNKVQAEVWAGEQIVTEVDAETRREKRADIRELTAEAVQKRWTPEKLASELGHATQEWSRNWNRIARTELQAAHNEGVAIESLRAYGDEARVARIPESNACADCKRLFLDDEGQPIIWNTVDLLENGTNIGRKRAEWLPTLYPIHSNCRCGAMQIPPGMTLNDKGWLVAE